MKKRLIFVATTPFAVNAFLRTHILVLRDIFDVTLCVNTEVYDLLDEVAQCAQVIHIPIKRKIAPWSDLKALVQLWLCFIRQRPDIVHSITPKAGLLAMMAACLAFIPHRFHTFTGQVWVNRTGVTRRILKGFDQVIACMASRAFADSQSQCRFLEAEGVVRAGEATVLGKGSIAGVDLARFRPDPALRMELRSREGISDETPVFVFIGRLTRDKGIFDLLAAFDAAATMHDAWHLWIIGPDEEGLQSKLQATGNKGHGQIRWFGPSTHPEHFLAAADILVLPSYREGFGSVIIEAAACGLPAIAYRIDGVVDAIVDGNTGLMVPLHDKNAFSEAMEKLARDNTLRRLLGEQAMRHARQDFSSVSVTAEWEKLYRLSVLGNASCGS